MERITTLLAADSRQNDPDGLGAWADRAKARGGFMVTPNPGSLEGGQVVFIDGQAWAELSARLVAYGELQEAAAALRGAPPHD